ncbi:MAG: Lrp/AsnC family transcriptional regulator [Burkholderiaceae bacterium]
MTMPALDELDQHLLALLQANARTPAATLARQTGAARTTILARLARLERQGVIAGYGLRLGQSLPAAAIRAHLSLSVAPRAGPAVVRAMERMIEVRRMWAVSGPFDYLAWIECESTERLDRALDRIGSLEGVRRTETSVILGVKIDRSGSSPST